MEMIYMTKKIQDFNNLPCYTQRPDGEWTWKWSTQELKNIQDCDSNQ